MVDLDPSNHRVLLVGPRVVHLKPLFDKHGYPVVVAPKGVEGMAHLDTDPCDLVLLELNLGDLTATEFLMAARQGHPRATFLLIDEATRAGQIVKALQAGLDGYLATPPDEERLFYEVERHLRRVMAEDEDPSGFEEHSTQTTMTTMADVDAMQGVGGDGKELERARQALATMQQDVLRFEEDARRYAEVQQVLGGHLEARLDGDEAMRLRERLSLAQVGEIELMTLRGDVQNLRQTKRDQEARIDEILRELKMARAAASAAEDLRATAETAMPVQPVVMAMDAPRIAELEAEVANWAMRSKELEKTLSAAKKALSLAEEEVETAVLEARATARIELDAITSERDAAAHARAEFEERTSLLEAEIARLGGILERAEAAGAAKEALVTAEHAEVERLRLAVKKAEEALEGESARSAQDDIKRSAETEDAIAIAVEEAVGKERERLQAAHQAAVTTAVATERARLEREQTSALEMAMSAATAAAGDKASASLQKAMAAERERAESEKRAAIEAAVREAIATSRSASEATAEERLAAERAALEAQVAAARDDARQARERADDIELQLEEARTRAEFLEGDAGRVQAAADERVAAAEVAFKKEKLRLVDEKQAAASGSQEAVLKLERYREESAAARRLVEELQAQHDSLQAAADAGVEARERADVELRTMREERERDRDRTQAALDAVARVEAAMGALQSHARNLEAAEADARSAEAAAAAAADDAVARADAAEAAAIAAGAAVAEAASAAVQARAQVTALEATVARLGDELLDVKARAAVDAEDARTVASEWARRVSDLEAAAAATGGTTTALSVEVASLQSRLADAEAASAQSTAALAQALLNAEAHAALEATFGNQVAALQAALDEARTTQVAEQHGRDAQAASEAIAAVRDDANARIGAAEARLAATVDAANAELTRVRTEAQAVHAQASQAVAEVQGRLQAIDAERQALQVERQRLLAHVAELEASASAGAGQGQGNGHATEVAELTRRIGELQGQMAQADPAVMATVRSLVEAVDPLRWGLGSAIDYLHPFEGNDQSLASHVRNLRLLQATLARLVAESGRGAASG